MVNLNKKFSSYAQSVKLTQIGSHIGRKYDQKQTLVGLGLNKMHRTVFLKRTDSVMGMVKKVSHLLKIEFID